VSAEQTTVVQRRGRAPLSPGLLQTLRDCAADLDKSLALRVGVMDSQSRIETVFREQRAIIEDVSRRLRELA
jgi:hypothetical protein